MKSSIAVFCLSMLIAVLLGAEEKPNVLSDFQLSKHKAGRIERGMTIDVLYDKYGRDSTKLVDLYLEGAFSPALEIHLNEGDKTPSLVAGIGGGGNTRWDITYIDVYDKKFKTNKGIGVGSTFGDISKSYEVNWVKSGFHGLFARVNEIGMSFELDSADVPREWYNTQDQNLIDAVRVVRVRL